MVFFLMIGAYILMKFFTVSKLPYVLSQSITNLPIPPMAVMAGIGILYIVLGMFLDILSAIIITVPIIFPAVTALGFDPIWFGVIITMLVQIGLVTPPVRFGCLYFGGSYRCTDTDDFQRGSALCRHNDYLHHYLNDISADYFVSTAAYVMTVNHR